MCAINLEDSFSFGADKKVGGEGAFRNRNRDRGNTLLMRLSLWPGATPDAYDINRKQQLV